MTLFFDAGTFSFRVVHLDGIVEMCERPIVLPFTDIKDGLHKSVPCLDIADVLQYKIIELSLFKLYVDARDILVSILKHKPSTDRSGPQLHVDR